MKENIDINSAYQRLAFRSYLVEHLSLINAPNPIFDGATISLKEARALVDSLGTFDPIKLKKHIELAIIRKYAADTKTASCYSCETAHQIIFEGGRSCPAIDNSDPSDPKIALVIPFSENADKACDQYVRINFTIDTDAQMLPDILSALHKKYGIDKDLIYRYI